MFEIEIARAQERNRKEAMLQACGRGSQMMQAGRRSSALDSQLKAQSLVSIMEARERERKRKKEAGK